MSIVEVRDHALWAKHIHGNSQLKDKILAMPEGDLIELVVDGWQGTWVKMADGKDGRPTPGIKGVGTARQNWHGMTDRRGSVVPIEEVQPLSPNSQPSPNANILTSIVRRIGGNS